MSNLNLEKITVVFVSFRSSDHLNRLFSNLIEKADSPEIIKFLIVDNTNGEDENLPTSIPDNLNYSIIPNEGEGLQRSISHSSALDKGLKNSETEFTLLVDPDIHVFKKGWDTFCLKQFHTNDKMVIGAPYPIWKLGKVHDYPSVVFMFFKTELVQSFKKSFYPFPGNLKRIWNSIIRKIVRLGGIGNKYRLNQFQILRYFCGFLENITGITAPDTGKEIIETFRQHQFQTITFKTPYPYNFDEKEEKPFFDIARDFEIYFQIDDPFLTHMYSSGVYHWRTEKGSDKAYWQTLITHIENGLRKEK